MKFVLLSLFVFTINNSFAAGSTQSINLIVTEKGFKIKKELPLNKTVNIEIGKLEKGEIEFACGMDMVSGVIFAK